jgi:hypothetical protein
MIGQYGLFELRETAPAIRSMSMVLSTRAATVTAITIVVSDPSVIGATARPAAAAAIAKTAELNATRIGGRCPRDCTTAVAMKATSAASAQPKSTAIATGKTNESEMPPESTPSIGTG